MTKPVSQLPLVTSTFSLKTLELECLKKTFKPIETGILSIPFAFHPYDGWLLFVMPGVEFAGVHTEFLFRRGIGYEVELSGDHTFTPGLKVDFVNDEANFVFGAGFGTRFSAIRWFPRKFPLSVISGHSAGFV